MKSRNTSWPKQHKNLGYLCLEWLNFSTTSTNMNILVSILVLYVLNEQNNYLQKLNIFQRNKCSRYLFQFVHGELPENRTLIYESSLIDSKMICESSMKNENRSMKVLWKMNIDRWNKNVGLWMLHEIWKLIYESSMINENLSMKDRSNMIVDLQMLPRIQNWSLPEI